MSTDIIRLFGELKTSQPAHEIMVLITLATSEAFAVRTHIRTHEV